MRKGSLILAGAALALAAVPAQAQVAATSGSWAAPSGSSAMGVRVHRGPDAHRGDRNGHWRGPGRDRDRGWRGRHGNIVIYDSGLWALYNNRSWEPDSYNDWFQERTHRSLPRWVQNNGDCKRIYWSGGGWTC